MAAQDTVYPLVQPAAVDVADIEKELQEIWRSSAEAEGGNAVMRAAAFTLIYAVRGAADRGMVNEMLVELTQRHPSRAILLHLNDHAEPSMQAWVTAYCHRPSQGTAPVCSDFITLEANGQSASAVVSTLLSLFVAGLPSVLAWDSSLPADHPVLLRLGPELDRVILSVIPPCAPASKLSVLFSLMDTFGEGPVLTDLSETFARPWQIAVARLFDTDPNAAGHIREVHFSYSADKIPVELLLVASWLSVVLGWQSKRITLRGRFPAILFDGDRAIEFSGQSDPNTKEHIEFQIGAPETAKTLRCEEPMGENRLAELLHTELQIWGRDPLRDESLRRARLWLKDLLFT